MSEWQGFYSTAQVSRLARIPTRTLYDWKARGIIVPSVYLMDGELEVDYGYSYADLTIIKLMRALREGHLELKSVGIALRHLYDRLGPPSHGWANTTVYIVGKKVFADKSDEWEVTAATQFGNKFETRLFGDLFEILREQEEEGDILVPKGFSRYIEINPDVMDGQPVVRDTRIPTAMLAMLSDKGKSIKDICRLYSPLPRVAIEKAIEYERFLASPIASS